MAQTGPFVILLCLMPDDFTCQERALISEWELTAYLSSLIVDYKLSYVHICIWSTWLCLIDFCSKTTCPHCLIVNLYILMCNFEKLMVTVTVLNTHQIHWIPTTQVSYFYCLFRYTTYALRQMLNAIRKSFFRISYHDRFINLNIIILVTINLQCGAHNNCTVCSPMKQI